MSDEIRDESADELALARATIARQAEELERLRRRVADERLAEDLRDALALTGIAGEIASPVTHDQLLGMIVETAAHVISARAGALFLIDEAAGDLVFEVAIGPKAQEVKKFRVPLGHGIAGLVAISGQPMAISDAQRDSRQAADIARGVGYAPDSILCVPLYYGDDVIGVLELLDKEGAPSFGTADMAMLGLFANQAAVAIEQSRIHVDLAALLDERLRGVGSAALGERTSAFAERAQGAVGYGRSLELARLVREISHRGDAESSACHVILEAFAEYLRSRHGAVS